MKLFVGSIWISGNSLWYFSKVKKYLNVMAGEYDVRGRSSHEQVRKIKKVHIHENYGKVRFFTKNLG